MLAPEQRWYRGNAGTGKVLTPGKDQHQERGIRLEDIEERDRNGDNLPKPDAEGQLIGITTTHDTTRVESGKDEEITISIYLASVLFVQL